MLAFSLGVSGILFVLGCIGPLSVFPLDFGGLLYLAIAFAQICVFGLEFRNRNTLGEKPYIRYEVLASLLLLLFLFSWIYARNANMDYAQRFAAKSEMISFEQNSTIARLYTLARYIPAIALAVYWYLRRSRGLPLILRSALLWVGAAVVLLTIALPSALYLPGIGIFAWVALLPLFFILRRCGYARGLWLIGVYAAFSTMSIHYWLGGFNLVALQGADLIIVAYYLLFFSLGYFVLRKIPSPLFWALVWTVFSFYRHYGFSAFPWGLVTHAQYKNIALIQIAELTGIWGIEFIIVYWNAALVVVLERIIGMRSTLAKQLKISPGVISRMRMWKTWRPMLSPLIILCLVGGYGVIRSNNVNSGEDTVRIALIQNNTDPRKNDYTETFNILKRETSAALSENPDIVMWPETAFVPNIRRWSQEDPQYPFAALVRRLLDYQQATKTHLLVGNDDYVREVDAANNEVNRKNRNAAILFSDTGERLATYHKMRLVPFTEYFPYKRLFPRLYNFLLDFDVTFWEPGNEAVVFTHPKFSFGVMICFEDSFPDSARPLVRNGADVLVNLGNDYWAEDPVEAQQHLATAVFRSVEHRRPFVRATTSGITSFINDRGKVWARLPQYTIGHLVETVDLPADATTTLYTRWGNWFVYVLMAMTLGFIAYSFTKRKR